MRPSPLIGFAAATASVVEHAMAQRTRKGVDWMIANNVSANEFGESVMGGDRNRVHLVSAAGVEDWPEMTKAEVAEKLAARIARELKGAA